MAGGTLTHALKTVSISADLPATNDVAGFEAVGITWTEIGEITTAAGWGRTNNEASYLPLKERMQKRRKGSYDYAPLSIEAAVDSADAGQNLALTASASDSLYSVKMEYSNGDIKYAQCLIMGFDDDTGGGVDDFIMVTITAQPVYDVVRKLAP